MIGKAEWFGRRKYTGWGLTPRTWQGWVYVIVMVAPFVLLTNAHNIGLAPELQLGAMVLWGVVFSLDVISMMIRVPQDEREKKHEAIAERNALWTMILVLILGVAFQAASSVVRGELVLDPFILAAVIAALVVKTASNIYLDKKD